MLYYFTFSSVLNTHTLKTQPSYKVNWDHELVDISLSKELNQTGMLGEHLAHSTWLKFLERVTMSGLLWFSSPKATFSGTFQRSGNLSRQ